MLERMSDFFENRLDGYDEHMLTNIESSDEFYPFTAKCLPTEKTAVCLIWAAEQAWNWKNTFR